MRPIGPIGLMSPIRPTGPAGRMGRVALLGLWAFLATTLFAQKPAVGVLVENVVTRSDNGQTYTLYLPTTYDLAQKHPLLFVFDPRGRGTSAAEIFREGAERFGWVVISSNGTRSDDDGEANDRAVRALVGEIARYAIDRKRVYAAGFSGTAVLAWGVGLRTGALAGVIAVGGRLVAVLPPSRFSFAHYGFAGVTDFNNREMRVIDTMLTDSGKVPHCFEEFAGAHEWITPALAADAIEWLEIVAGKGDATAYVAEQMGVGAALERAGNRTAALRHYRGLVRTFESDAARTAVSRLETDAATLAAVRDEAKWDAFEAQSIREITSAVPRIYARARQEGTALTAVHIAQELRVPELKRRARRPGAEGLTARRLLEAIYTQTSFYITEQLVERREHAFAAATLGVAADIHRHRWYPWFRLSQVYTETGQARQAKEALDQAIARGYRETK
jgi:predicted esterase